MPDSCTLLVIGGLNLDLRLPVPRLPVPGETQTATVFTRQPGGKGANQAVAVAHLGARTAMLGCVGNDDAARLLLGTLQEAGIAIETIAHCAEPTGTAVILLAPSGENSIVVAPGANSMLSPAHLLRHKTMLTGAGMILPQLETPMAVLEQTLAIATEIGVPVMLDPAPAAPLSQKLLRQVA